jgi:hypothetical protein
VVGYRDVGYLVGVKGCIYTYSISVSSVVTLQALYPPNYPYTGIFQYSKIQRYSLILGIYKIHTGTSIIWYLWPGTVYI